MTEFQGTQGKLSPFLQRARIKAVKGKITGHVFDIGCGDGVLAQYFPADQYLGFDLNSDVVETCRVQYPDHKFVAKLPKKEGVFDTVVAMAVIEHVPDPKTVLLEWAKYLKPGGRMVLTTPHPAFEWAHEGGAKIGLFSHDAAEEHEEMIDHKLMKELVNGTVLKIILYKRFLFGVNQLFILEKES